MFVLKAAAIAGIIGWIGGWIFQWALDQRYERRK